MTVLIEEEVREERDAAASTPESSSSPAKVGQTLFSFPGRVRGIALDDNGSILVSDSASGAIWQMGVDGTTSALLSDSAPCEYERRTCPAAPAGLARSPDGSLFVADPTRNRVCALSPDGAFRVVAGSANGYRDGPADEALFRSPSDVAFGPDGTCYVADTGNDRIRAITPDGVVTTVAGSIYDYGDGHGPGARFRRPTAIDVDAGGDCYVADTGNNTIRRVSPHGAVTTVAGAPPGGDRDGQGRGVGLRWPTGIALGADGSVWVADHGNGALRRLDPDGTSSTVLRLSGRRWPTAVAPRADGTVVVAGVDLADVAAERGWLRVLGAGR